VRPGSRTKVSVPLVLPQNRQSWVRCTNREQSILEIETPRIASWGILSRPYGPGFHSMSIFEFPHTLKRSPSRLSQPTVS
jgi:hypothetical protein